jgi:uncharacterized SAM-binding protein YcdF (DUF218 family)
VSFLYSALLGLLQPIPFCIGLLVASVILSKRKLWSRICLWTAVGVLVVCGNKWVVEGLAGSLERTYPSLSPVPKADCIVVLGGGTLPRVPPRSTVEVADAGDRVIYAAYLFREGCAPLVICTGAQSSGGSAPRPAAEDMSELLQFFGVPARNILKELKAQDTHQHAVNLQPVFHEHGFKHVVVVTSAMHMPRSMAVFRRGCPGIDFTAAPTDFRATEERAAHWYRRLLDLIPNAGHLLDFSDVLHEYLGILYYKCRGWI